MDLDLKTAQSTLAEAFVTAEKQQEKSLTSYSQ